MDETNVVSKLKMDKVIALIRKRNETGSIDYYDDAIDLCKKISLMYWVDIIDLLTASLNFNATNDQIYEIFKVLGYEIK